MLLLSGRESNGPSGTPPPPAWRTATVEVPKMVGQGLANCRLFTIGLIADLKPADVAYSASAIRHLVKKSHVSVPSHQPQLSGPLTPVHLNMEIYLGDLVPAGLSLFQLIRRERSSVFNSIQAMNSGQGDVPRLSPSRTNLSSSGE